MEKKRRKSIILIIIFILILFAELIIFLYFVIKKNPYIDIDLSPLFKARLVFRPYNITLGEEVLEFPLNLLIALMAKYVCVRFNYFFKV